MADQTLDADQLKAAAHRQGKACVAAAAGAGKTFLLVQRAIALVEAGAPPAAVMTLCFNTNAAVTLQTRLKEHPRTRDYAASMASTFHAFGRGIMLKAYPGYDVLSDDRDEKKPNKLLARELDALAWHQLNADTWVPKASREEVAKAHAGMVRPTPEQVTEVMAKDQASSRSRYGRWKVNRAKGEWQRKVISTEVSEHAALARERLFDAQSPYGKWFLPGNQKLLLAQLRTLGLPGVTDDQLVGLSHFLPLQRDMKMTRKLMDFTDMLVGTASLLVPEDDGSYKSRHAVDRLSAIQHLQVDEAQDGSFVRWYIAQRHVELRPDGSTMAVGDQRQSIQGFAGAQPELFQAWWDTSVQFSLPRNYRSAGLIVEAGNAVARGEVWNLGGDSIAAKPELGAGSVSVRAVGAFAIAKEIAEAIALGHIGEIENRKTKLGGPVYDVTVLARLRSVLSTVAFALRSQSLYATVRGQHQSVWTTAVGRTLRAALSLPERLIPKVPLMSDAGVVTWSFDYAGAVMALNGFGTSIDVPTYGMNATHLELWSTAGDSGAFIDIDKVNAYANTANKDHYISANVVRVMNQATMLASQSWQRRLDWALEITLAKLDEDAPDAQVLPSEGDQGLMAEALARILSVATSLAQVDTIVSADVQLPPKGTPVIELSTIHSAKGDQWGTVYVAGVEENILPHIFAVGPEREAEELRLLYVAVTRPVHTLIVDVTPGPTRFAAKLSALADVATGTPPAPSSHDFSPPDNSDADDDDDAPDQDPNNGAEIEETPDPAYKPGLVSERFPGRTMQDRTPRSMYTALEAGEGRAEMLTKASPVRSAPGQKFVVISRSELVELLQPYGFIEDPQPGSQRVLVSTMDDGSQLKLYTSIPKDAETARSVGADSMKVAMLSAQGRPMAPKQTPMSRTKNWRSTLLERFTTLLQLHPQVRA